MPEHLQWLLFSFQGRVNRAMFAKIFGAQILFSTVVQLCVVVGFGLRL